jgi:hypothetical protein
MRRNDGELSRDEVLEHLRFLCAAIKDLSALAELVSVVAPKPVNALLLGPEMHVAGLADAGARRVSTGGGLAAALFPVRKRNRVGEVVFDSHQGTCRSCTRPVTIRYSATI